MPFLTSSQDAVSDATLISVLCIAVLTAASFVYRRQYAQNVRLSDALDNMAAVADLRLEVEDFLAKVAV